MGNPWSESHISFGWASTCFSTYLKLFFHSYSLAPPTSWCPSPLLVRTLFMVSLRLVSQLIKTNFPFLSVHWESSELKASLASNWSPPSHPLVPADTISRTTALMPVARFKLSVFHPPLLLWSQLSAVLRLRCATVLRDCLLFKAPCLMHVLMRVQAPISVGDAEIFCYRQRDQWKSFAEKDAKLPLSQSLSWLQVFKKSSSRFFLKCQLQREMYG